MNRDRKTIEHSFNVIVLADKTTNMHSVSPHTYKNMLTNNFMTTYKKTIEVSVNAVNREAKAIVKPLKIEDRLKHPAPMKLLSP